jgi:hypothetical protein
MCWLNVERTGRVQPDYTAGVITGVFQCHPAYLTQLHAYPTHFSTEDGGTMLFQNVCVHLQDCMVSQHRRPQSEYMWPQKPENLLINVLQKLVQFIVSYS